MHVEDDHEAGVGEGLNGRVKDFHGAQAEKLRVCGEGGLRERGMERNGGILQGLLHRERQADAVEAQVLYIGSEDVQGLVLQATHYVGVVQVRAVPISAQERGRKKRGGVSGLKRWLGRKPGGGLTRSSI